MKQIAVLKYTGTALPTGSTTETLMAFAQASFASQMAGLTVYSLRLRNSHAGTIKAEKSDDGITWTIVDQQDIPASVTSSTNKYAIAINAYPFFRVRWTNGGVTQTTFDPMQCLLGVDIQFDQFQESSARLRGPVQDATNNFAYQAGTTSEQFAIPTAWKGRRVDISVVGTALTAAGLAPTCWFVFGTADTVDVDRARFVSGTPPAFTGHVDIGRPIGHGETRDYYVDPAWTHFAVEADTAATGVYIMLSDYPPQIVD